MSDKPRIGTDNWMVANPHRIGIFNDNYGTDGSYLGGNGIFCWYVTYRGKHWGGGFPSQQDATDYLREELTNARVS